jgi:lipid-binding SYLF domain-containing protein
MGAMGVLLLAASAAAQEAGDLSEREALVDDAVSALGALVAADDADAIPDWLLERAEAIAVVPGVIRGALIVGGRWGEGVVVRRDAARQWGPASFVEVGGASVGFQIGADSTDLVLVFTEPEAVDALLEDRVELGVDVSVAAGPIGRSIEVGTNLTLDAPIVGYSRSKGVFAGAALDGTVVTIDDSANEDVFGHPVDGDEVLAGAAGAPAVFDPLVALIDRVTSAAANQ